MNVSHRKIGGPFSSPFSAQFMREQAKFTASILETVEVMPEEKFFSILNNVRSLDRRIACHPHSPAGLHQLKKLMSAYLRALGLDPDPDAERYWTFDDKDNCKGAYARAKMDAREAIGKRGVSNLCALGNSFDPFYPDPEPNLSTRLELRAATRLVDAKAIQDRRAWNAAAAGLYVPYLQHHAWARENVDYLGFLYDLNYGAYKPRARPRANERVEAVAEFHAMMAEDDDDTSRSDDTSLSYESALRRIELELQQVDEEADELLLKAPAGEPLSFALEFRYAQVVRKYADLFQQREHRLAGRNDEEETGRNSA